MNEIKKIHLGRQPFTISVEAHRALRAYLEAIEHQVGKKGEDVLKEIELRMAELLTERGITADKVVLEEDIAFLKEQLGAPGDFKDESDGEAAEGEHVGTRDHNDQRGRLYRDPQNAMLAGVASGLAAYFRIDPLIVRLIFIVLAFGGAGILVYILLWILVPEAKSPSERLQMRGKAVTVDNIKEIVDRADVPAAANRAGKSIGKFLSLIAKLILGLTGIVFVTAGVAAMAWALIMGVYLLIHGGQVGTDIVFPIGAREVILLISGLITAAMLGLMLTLVGIAMIGRKWKAPTWATASIVGLFFVGASAGTALAFDVFPAVRQRYRDAHKTQTRSLPAFTSVNLSGDDVHYTFKQSNSYYLDISYLGNVTEQNLSTTVEGDVLKIDATKFMDHPLCSGFCFYGDHDLNVTIYAPSLERVRLTGDGASLLSMEALDQKNMIAEIARGSQITLASMNPEEVRLSLPRGNNNVSLLEMYDIQSKGADMGNQITVREGYASIDRADRIQFKPNATCDESDPVLRLSVSPKELRINDSDAIKTVADLHRLRSSEVSNDYNCVTF